MKQTAPAKPEAKPDPYDQEYIEIVINQVTDRVTTKLRSIFDITEQTFEEYSPRN